MKHVEETQTELCNHSTFSLGQFLLSRPMITMKVSQETETGKGWGQRELLSTFMPNNP